jgi:hypothetical protein
MIWLRFVDDNEATPLWPSPSVLPDWARRFVDTAYSPTGNYFPGAVSGYFYENSYGRYHVIGDVYYVTLDESEQYFHQIAASQGAGAARSAIEIEAFNKLDAAPFNVDFRRYDNWIANNQNTPFGNTPGHDNVLDMCWFMTRNLRDDAYAPGSRFGIGWATLDCSSLTKDGILIKGSDYFFPASGIGMFAAHAYRTLNSSTATDDSYPLVNHVAHEMTHYFFGYDHFAQGQPFLSSTRANALMGPYAGGWRGHYSGYEKWRLRWLLPTVIGADTDVNLYELGSTMDSTKTKLIKIPISGSTQYYLIEYRGWSSAYEFRRVQFSAAPGMLKPGILAYLIIQEEDYLTHTKCFMPNADGMFRYNLRFDGGALCSQPDDVIERAPSDNLKGYHETGDIFISGRSTTCSYDIQGAPIDESWYASYNPYPTNPFGGGPVLHPTNYLNSTTQGSDLQGDSLDLFQTGDVITPWSNPGSHLWAGGNAVADSFLQTSLGIEIGQFQQGSGFKWYNISVKLSIAQSLSPSKPQDLQAAFNPSNQAVASWTANQEPDVTTGGGYDLYRAVYWGSASTYTKLNGTLLTTPTFTDSPPSPAGAPSGVDVWYRYQVKAKDSQGKYSVPSEDFWLYGGKTVSGTISTTTWDGMYLVIGDVTLPSGQVLTIQPGATIKFDASKSLSCNGRLVAQGTSSLPIKLTSIGSNWSGTYLGGAGANNSTLSYVNISNVLTYGGSVLNVYNATGTTITHCGITNSGNYSTTGMYFTNAGSPEIAYNTISGCGSYGIQYYNTGGYLYANGIDWNTSGGVNLSYSSPSFGKPGFPAYNGNNTIQGGVYGIYAANNSYPYVGSYGNSYYGYNNLVGGATARVFATGGCNVMAENNWWGSPYPNSGWFQAVNNSTIDWNPYLYGQIGPLRRVAAVKHPDSMTASPLVQTLPDTLPTLRKAWELLAMGDAKQAGTLFLGVVRSSPSEMEAMEAMAGIQQAFAVTMEPTLLLWVQGSEKAPKLPEAFRRLVLGRMFLAQGKLAEAGRVFEDLAATNSATSSFGKAALLDLFGSNLSQVSREEEAASALAGLTTALGTMDPDVRQAQWVWGLIHGTRPDAPNSPEVKKITTASVPLQTNLWANFPNPFNPSTTIRFSIADGGRVRLRIFDVLGRDLATPVDAFYGAGVYDLSWNAQSAASGVYFAQLEVTDALGKLVYSRTNKLLLSK